MKFFRGSDEAIIVKSQSALITPKPQNPKTPESIFANILFDDKY